MNMIDIGYKIKKSLTTMYGGGGKLKLEMSWAVLLKVWNARL